MTAFNHIFYLAIANRHVWYKIPPPLTKGRFGIYPIVDGRCYWIAIDIDGHNSGQNPDADVRSLSEASTTLGIPLVVFSSNSGMGYHCYLFFEHSEAFQKAIGLLQALIVRCPGLTAVCTIIPNSATGAIGNLIALPFSGEAVRDRKSTLQVDGYTLKPICSNIQEGVTYLHTEIERISSEKLDDLLKELGVEPESFSESRISSVNNHNKISSSWETLRSQCVFMAFCEDNAVTLPEPPWYSMISNLCRLTGGVDLIHQLSKPYPQYTRKETDEKILHAMNSSGPITCNKIKEFGYCGDCPGISVPIQLTNPFTGNEAKANGTLAPETIKNPLPPGEKSLTGNEILNMNFPEPLWLVPEILPVGVCLLGGKPKTGKSLMAGNLAVSVATGGKFFGYDLERKVVLLLGLEDTKRRLKDRFIKMTNRGVNLESLHIRFEFKKANQGGLEELAEMIITLKPALVIIDTLKKFKATSNGRKQLYDEHYEDVDGLKQIADRFNVTILIVHHLRKMESEDPFDSFSGSLGLTGAADTLWVLQRNKSGMVLSITGREVEENAFAVKLHKDILTWDLLGNADEIQSTSQRQKVFNAIKSSSQPITSREISIITDFKDGAVRKILSALNKEGTITKTDRGKYIIEDYGYRGYKEHNGNNGDNENNVNNGDNNVLPYGDSYLVLSGEQTGNNIISCNNSEIDTIVPVVPNVPHTPENVETEGYEVTI